MRFTQDTGSNGYIIHAFDAEGVTLQAPGGTTLRLNTSFILAPDRLLRDWAPRTADQLLPTHFAAIAAMDPEVVLLGTGLRQHFPSPALLVPLMESGVGVEVMDSHAACRTYIVLTSEGRRVVAALLLP